MKIFVQIGLRKSLEYIHLVRHKYKQRSEYSEKQFIVPDVIEQEVNHIVGVDMNPRSIEFIQRSKGKYPCVSLMNLMVWDKNLTGVLHNSWDLTERTNSCLLYTSDAADE